jgi:large subunit ribosomal protein L10
MHLLNCIKDITKDKGEGKPQLKAAYVQESFYVGAENLDALVNVKSKKNLLEMLSCCCNLLLRMLFLLFNRQGGNNSWSIETFQER